MTDKPSSIAAPGIALIWAMSRNRAIGLDNDLPWHLPADLKHFKATTKGKPMVMGRRTFDSIGRRPLPGRPTIVVTRDAGFASDDVAHEANIDDAIAHGRRIASGIGADEVIIAGGSAIYEACLPLADTLYVTEVDADIAGDTFFPDFDLSHWHCRDERAFGPDAKHRYGFRIQTWERV
ncbi:MAG: dihydrofolate reductase [Pseudomonadaceae bacterium]|nr:dihydrofolate reductase [Pseudomonadaceae bacterium]